MFSSHSVATVKRWMMSRENILHEGHVSRPNIQGAYFCGPPVSTQTQKNLCDTLGF